MKLLENRLCICLDADYCCKCSVNFKKVLSFFFQIPSGFGYGGGPTMMLCSAQMMPQSMAYGGGPAKRRQPRKMLATKAMRHSAPATGGVSKKRRKAKKLTVRKRTGGRASPKNPKTCNADSVAEAMDVQSPEVVRRWVF